MKEITEQEKFELICKRLDETGYKDKLSKEAFDALCKKIMSKSTIELAMCGYNAVRNEIDKNV